MRRKNIEKAVSHKSQNATSIVDMKGRESVRIYIPKEADAADGEILQLQILAQRQREEIKKAYYSVNTPISSTIDRTFSDLFKRFVQLKMERVINNKIV